MPTTLSSTAPLDLGRDTLVHLADDLSTTPLSVDASFWEHIGAAKPELASGRILCVSDYADTWTWWEVHPDGDELVLLLSGGVDVVLESGSDSHSVALLPGQATIVPAGTWHRVVVRTACRMLFVTPTPARTQVRPHT
jgi:mannose-6-phosphate isomerase-like protein (cupin superfamily)